MHKTLTFWLVLYLISLIYTIVSLFNKLYRDDRDKHAIDGSIEKLVVNFERGPRSLSQDLFYDFEDFLNRKYRYNVLLYIVIKPMLGVLLLSVLYFITYFADYYYFSD